jgi:hypothetical protein
VAEPLVSLVKYRKKRKEFAKMDTLTSNFHQLEIIVTGCLVTSHRWKLPCEAGTKTGNLRANEGTQNTNKIK